MVETKKSRPRKKAVPMTVTADPKRQVSDDQRVAMSEGRHQSKAIRQYLEALEQTQAPKRKGRRRTQESIEKRLNLLAEEMPKADPLARVKMVQERLNLQRELGEMHVRQTVDIEPLQEQFLKVVKPYSERLGISFAAWKELGVPMSLLTEAGLGR
jgi:hypothetical protein